MHASLIICTKNRAQQLKRCLEYVAAAAKPKRLVEIVIVDNNSTDETESVIRCYAERSTLPAKYIKCEKPGLGSARNYGVLGSSGEWLIFTDDDCYIEEEFFINFFRSIDNANLHLLSPLTKSVIMYGSGQIRPYDKDDDNRVSNLAIDKIKIIRQSTIVRPGDVQGASMFFHRSIFDQVGLFNENTGAGTSFPCEDIEMAARASLNGYIGAQVPEFKVVHHHKRKSGSLEAISAVEGYDYGRGAYYASLIDRELKVWDVWGSENVKNKYSDSDSKLRLAREFRGAAKYLEVIAGARDDDMTVARIASDQSSATPPEQSTTFDLRTIDTVCDARKAMDELSAAVSVGAVSPDEAATIARKIEQAAGRAALASQLGQIEETPETRDIDASCPQDALVEEDDHADVIEQHRE
jgi:glycosyltransferase involved in cell wall biosynthesis